MRQVTKERLIWLIVALQVIVAGWTAHDARDQSRVWERLRDAHHCQIVRTEDPPAGIGTTPGKTVWLCDGGELIVRNSQ